MKVFSSLTILKKTLDLSHIKLIIWITKKSDLKDCHESFSIFKTGKDSSLTCIINFLSYVTSNLWNKILKNRAQSG